MYDNYILPARPSTGSVASVEEIEEYTVGRFTTDWTVESNGTYTDAPKSRTF